MGNFSCTPPLGSQIFITCAILVTLLAWSTTLLDQNECFSPLVENQVRLQLYSFLGMNGALGWSLKTKRPKQGRNFYLVGVYTANIFQAIVASNKMGDKK